MDMRLLIMPIFFEKLILVFSGTYTFVVVFFVFFVLVSANVWTL